jgi:NAD(P)-dependent dehydrogenase (short-subunit alcohol dehydrogenase family)
MSESTTTSAPGVAVVTGGASGFGRAIGERCAMLGWSVALLDVDGERVATEAEAIARQQGVQALGLSVNVASASDVEAAAARVAEHLGRVDMLFSNVGVQQIGALERFSDEAWEWMLNVNVIGTARVVRSFLPLLRRSSHPRLVFTASASVLAPASRLAAYQASKFAVVGLAETLVSELSDDGIAVSVIYPSGMMTRHLESSLAARPTTITESIVQAGDTEALIASSPYIGAVSTPEDAARHVVDEVLAGERHVVTHGDLLEPIDANYALLRRAAERSGGATQP